MKRQLFDLKWWIYRPQAYTRFKQLQKSQYWSCDRQHVADEEARRLIVTNAMERSAFYRRFYGEAGFELGDMGQDSWFEKLPVLTKQHLREHFDDILDNSKRQFLATSTTGGSTGEPTRTGYDQRLPEEVYGWRLQSWFGVHPGDDRANIWRATHSTLKSRVLNSLLWWPTRHLKLDATFISKESIFNFLDQYNAIKPLSLEGYVGGMVQVADFIQKSGIKVWNPRLIQVTSSPISLAQKDVLAKVFHAPICDQYGSCEVRWIAQSCPRDCGLHVNVEHVHLEFVDSKNRVVAPGQYGRTLLTNLEDTVFPMIRYENGDRGRYLQCSCECGRTLPLIDSVKGRNSESFTLPSGKTINGEYLTTIFDEAPELVRNFRVIQHKDMSITVESILASKEYKSKVERIVAAFADKIENEVDVECRFVDYIADDRGKLRFVIREW